MIRPGRATDIEAIVALERDIFGDDAWSTTQVAADVEASSQTVLVAEADERLVGYAVVALAGDVADILRIAVRESSRRAGVASALLREAERVGTAGGAGRVMLEVSAQNVGAQGFYGARGYLEIARRHAYYADGSDAIVLARALG